MPELPEAETIVKQLQKHLRGKKIASTVVMELQRADKHIETIKSIKVLKIWRRAKAIIIELGGKKFLLVRLGMTGHFHYASKGEGLGSDEKYAIVKFFLSDSSVLSYTDIRKFGSVRLLTIQQLQQKLAEFGPEPLGKEFTPDFFQKLLQRKKGNVKVALMDQNFIAGLGNIYAQEALYHASINPRRTIAMLKAPEIQLLHHAIQQVLTRAITHNGTTVENYVHIEGAGGFQRYLAVYGRTACPKHHPLKKIYLGGRGTYYCPTCQR
ncbi:bifunctional DNA-formamidopyrimidine glycosylase/DNA-(apurinic or apyrimidinic site) lyase [Candidatus Woesearchaeota archaeon]|nr:bifunctional DNA-formamidopyrimidine glycosylase/DNA-(apurinic or apyrimidinic site) lyase [Candidatus Woesearchaeota archaeon]